MALALMSPFRRGYVSRAARCATGREIFSVAVMAYWRRSAQGALRRHVLKDNSAAYERCVSGIGDGGCRRVGPISAGLFSGAGGMGGVGQRELIAV